MCKKSILTALNIVERKRRREQEQEKENTLIMDDENDEDLDTVVELDSYSAKGFYSQVFALANYIAFFVWPDNPKPPKRASKLSAMQFLERKLERKADLKKIELELKRKELELKEIQMEREHEEQQKREEDRQKRMQLEFMERKTMLELLLKLSPK